MDHSVNTRQALQPLRLLAVGGFLLLAACATQPQTHAVNNAPPSVARPDNAAVGQKTFASPEDAAEALVAASRDENKAELLQILGPRADKLISSGDPVADHEARQKFVTSYDKAHTIEIGDNGRAILFVGEEEWPMPIPLVTAKDGWRFDSDAGAEEILNRRIGRNELNVLGVCRAYVEAQQEFAEASPSGTEYAQRFYSHDGQHDGLYWPAAEGEDESPFGSLIADAMIEGYSAKAISKHTPYHGYYYRILKQQGPHAPTGAKDYIVNGRMVNGFALIAFPARYGDSGIMTFLVNQNGIVYEKNLGRDTTRIARSVTSFDPDKSWNVVR